MSTAVKQRDGTKHRYELVPIINDNYVYPHLLVGDYAHESTGEDRSIAMANELMGQRATVERYHVYHTHPSPGPVRRYVGRVYRGEQFIRRPQ